MKTISMEKMIAADNLLLGNIIFALTYDAYLTGSAVFYCLVSIIIHRREGLEKFCSFQDRNSTLAIVNCYDTRLIGT